MSDRQELLKLREERERANEAQRLWKLRDKSDEALEKKRLAALRRAADIEKVQRERNEA